MGSEGVLKGKGGRGGIGPGRRSVRVPRVEGYT